MTNARNTDRSTSHAAAKDLSVADRIQVRSHHIQHIRRGLADWELDDFSPAGHQNGRWRKRRCDLCTDKYDKFLIAAEDDPTWIGDKERRNPHTQKWQKVWIVRVRDVPALPRLAITNETAERGFFNVG